VFGQRSLQSKMSRMRLQEL